MRTENLWAVVVLTHLAGCGDAVTTTAMPELAINTIAFENVRVLPMSEDSILNGHTVVIDGDRIAALGPTASLTIPAGSRVIDGSGLTLMPGLADMHVHYLSGNEEGVLFVANGVTTVRNMWGTAEQIRLDIRAKNGDLVGPHVYTTGPLIDGAESIWGDDTVSIESPQAAIGAVESQHASGYSMIKLYEKLDPDSYRAAVGAAKERGMKIATHTPESMTVEELLDLQVDSIEHLDGYETALSGVKSGFPLATLNAWQHAETTRMESLAKRTVDAGVWNTPTLTIYTQLPKYNNAASNFFARPEVRYVSPLLLGFWQQQQAFMPPELLSVATAGETARNQFVKTLYDAGANLLVGTDTPNPFIVEGYSFHDELDNLSNVGIPNDDLLRMATIEAARFLGEEGEFGVVAKGARADLILVRGDPLTDLSVLREPVGVMVNGHWYERRDLQAILEANAIRFEREIQQMQEQSDSQSE